MKRNQSSWDPGRFPMGQGEPYVTSNGRRKCARNDGSAITFINTRRKTDRLYNSRAGAIGHNQSFESQRKVLDVPGGARN